jgi:hypothetical protein
MPEKLGENVERSLLDELRVPPERHVGNVATGGAQCG